MQGDAVVGVISVATNESEHNIMLTAAEAADHLGVKINTLYAYVSRGWLKSYRRRIGRQSLYRRSDVEALRRLVAPEHGQRARNVPEASSWVTVAQPRAVGEAPQHGVIVTESAISSIINKRLAYRGYPVEEVVAHASFEEACLLLWNGERPVAEDVGELRAAIAKARIPAMVSAAIGALGDDAPPLLRLSAMMPSLAAWERRSDPITRGERARRIVSILPLPLAPKPVAPISAEGGMAERLLKSVAGTDALDWEREAMNQILVACAEHEMNASTFAARVVASTGADLYASVLAALCSLSGPIHGGACDRIERMLAELIAGTDVEKCLDAFSQERRLPPGFGHHVYPAGDPRAVLLKKTGAEIARHKGGDLYDIAVEVERAVWKRKRLRPNLDFYLTVCARMLGFRGGLAAAIFAVGRSAGWIAHGLEQYENNRLIRPRMRYRGVPIRHWQNRA